jgi:phosphodiesterase/alkaline phosphatase D-like protein
MRAMRIVQLSLLSLGNMINLAFAQPVAHFDVLLGRPTDRSVAVSLLSDNDLQGFVEYGTQSGIYANHTEQVAVPKGTATVITVDSLQPDREYYYRVQYRSPAAASFMPGPEATFHTQRAAGSPFQFAIEADPHYMDSEPDVWRLDLANVVADHPDFLIDLGDTFMTEKIGVTTYPVAADLCSQVRTGFHSIIGSSVPLFLVNGNHEAELGWLLNSAYPHDNIAVWATQARQSFYPCPVAGDFYSGSTAIDTFLQKPRDGYYAFEWGNALFVALDPFWYTRTKPGTGWGWTLGVDQYQWLTRTLAQSHATFKFVFIHHLVGGSFDGIARGGTEFARHFEWGGRNQDSTWGFTTNRPGWPMPIQDLLLKYGVNIVFHGHDHFFDKQDLDANGDGVTDLIYQEVPQPSRDDSNAQSLAQKYGYASGAILSSPGHLRVQVTPTQAKIEYVRAVLPANQGPGSMNGTVGYTYAVNAPAAVPVPQASFDGTIILGRPTDRSISANVLGSTDRLVFFEYGLQSGVYSMQTGVTALPAGQPLEVLLDQLQPDSRYYYRLRFKGAGDTAFDADAERTFHTQRLPGSTFVFDIQGDSHPERAGKEFDANLYVRTLGTAAADQPDFYMAIGDDFSVDTLKTVNADTVRSVYVNQRQWLGLVGSPLFLVNGNHEQAAMANLDGTPNNVAVWAQNARNSLYPMPAPDGFYTGDAEPVPFIGPLRDYYAFTWGDALFAVIDFYWHSAQAVDNVFGADHDPKGNRDLWNVTLDPNQYQWLRHTLETSTAKYKFVFSHHVLGTQRGGIELARGYEWGGNNAGGTYGFDTHRPGWGDPIHQLMADHHVTIFFQGHDHVFVRQQLDGVTYQTLPEPADPYYTPYFMDRYLSGDKLPNSGYTRVTVAPAGVKVEYVRTFLPADEKPGQTSGMVAFSYAI